MYFVICSQLNGKAETYTADNYTEARALADRLTGCCAIYTAEDYFHFN